MKAGTGTDSSFTRERISRIGRCFFTSEYRVLSVCETPELFRGLENVTGAFVDKLASSKWVESQFGVNYPLKPEWNVRTRNAVVLVSALIHHGTG